MYRQTSLKTLTLLFFGTYTCMLSPSIKYCHGYMHSCFNLHICMCRTQNETMYKVFPANHLPGNPDIPDYIRYMSADRVITDKAYKIELPKVKMYTCTFTLAPHHKTTAF